MALTTEKQNTERGKAAEPGEPAEFDHGRTTFKQETDKQGPWGKVGRSMAPGTGLELGENGMRIGATAGHLDHRDCSGILSGSKSGLGIQERDCSLKNKSIERGCQDQENSDRKVIRLAYNSE